MNGSGKINRMGQNYTRPINHILYLHKLKDKDNLKRNLKKESIKYNREDDYLILGCKRPFKYNKGDFANTNYTT